MFLLQSDFFFLALFGIEVSYLNTNRSTINTWDDEFDVTKKLY